MKKQRTCWMCKDKFRGTHHKVREKDVADMKQLAKKTGAKRQNTKHLVCDPCYQEHFGKALYNKKAKKNIRNNQAQEDDSREAKFQNKQLNRIIADAKDEVTNTVTDV